MGAINVLAFLPVIFSDECYCSEINRIIKNNFPVIYDFIIFSDWIF